LEVAVPALVSSNLTEKGGFFPRREPPPGHGCVGRVVEGRTTLFRRPPRSRQGSNPGRMGHPWMSCCVRIVSSRKEKGEGGRGKYPGAPPHHLRKKEGREKQLADRKIPDRLGVIKGEGYKKKHIQGYSRETSDENFIICNRNYNFQ
jgi:hypothetical protein